MLSVFHVLIIMYFQPLSDSNTIVPLQHNSVSFLIKIGLNGKQDVKVRPNSHSVNSLNISRTFSVQKEIQPFLSNILITLLGKGLEPLKPLTE